MGHGDRGFGDRGFGDRGFGDRGFGDRADGDRGRTDEWIVDTVVAPAAELHGLDIPADGRRRVWVLEATRPAVVLGSTQPAHDVDAEAAAAAGVDVVRRRSGGGAVWVAPGDPIWVDVIIPAGDPLWTGDVGRAFGPVGRAWRDALGSLRLDGATESGMDTGALSVHDGAMRVTPWSAMVCFAGTGPGEVLSGSAKVVGISQRRTRTAARFQCAVHRRWDPAPMCSLLVNGPSPAALADVAVGIGPAVATVDVVRALVTALGAVSLD